MVIKTELCEYTEYRVYPGRGQRFVTKDGKVHFFISGKAASLFKLRIKPVKLRWTQNWRRMNKKGKAEETTRRRSRRTQKIQKAIVGLNLEDLKKKKVAKPSKKVAADTVKDHKAAAKKAAPRAAVQKVTQKVSTAAAVKPKIQAAGKR